MTSTLSARHAHELQSGQRFAFGENWRAFLATLDDERLATARYSLQAMLGRDSLQGLTLLDVGCGSGLFSLAAVQLGAAVHSLDFDPASVACAVELKRRYAASSAWTIEHGSALDVTYLRELGTFDVVYSWGVLHHTGAMWRAMANVAEAVAPGGRLFISIYNDQGRASRRWRRVKRAYNACPVRLRPAFVVAVMGPRELRSALGATLRLRPGSRARGWKEYKRNRGMSRWHDLVDWCGGYPFDVSKPEQVFEFYRSRGFVLEKLTTCGGGLGCNEFVFARGM